MIRLILLRLLESYFRHRVIYILPAILLSVTGSIYAFSEPPAYIARGNLYIQKETLLGTLSALPQDGFTYLTPAEITIDEIYELLSSSAFIRAIIQQTELEEKMGQGQDEIQQTIAETRRAIWVQKLGGNLVLIGAANEEPHVAHQLVISTIETYIHWKINVSRDESTAAQEFFADLITAYQAELEPAQQALTEYLTLHPEPLRGERPAIEKAEIARLQSTVDIVKSRLQNAEDKQESASLSLAQTASDVRQSYFMVDAPLLPTAPERSKTDIAMNMAVFSILGAFLSAVGIAGGALLDRTLRFPIDVRHGLTLPVLGMVPESAPGQSASSAPRRVTEPQEQKRPTPRRTNVVADSPNGSYAPPLIKRMRHPLGRR